MKQQPDPEIVLTGGRTSAGVVRIGNTVRRPVTANSLFVQRLLIHLAEVRFDGCPRYLGRDELGRDTLSFLPGEVPEDLGEFTDAQRESAAHLLRALHDATAGSALTGGSEVVCHGDASPCNFVFNAGLPYALIDFDAAAPGDRWDDLGYAAWHWLDIGNDEWAPQGQGIKLSKFFAAYGVSTVDDPIAVILSSQARICSRENGPAGNKEWASGCMEWTERNHRALRAGFDAAWQERY